MKIYLDDTREAPDGWVLVKHVDDLIYLLDCANEISLDHDLGDGEKTGYDFMRHLEQMAVDGEIKKPMKVYIHTANPVGRRNMLLCLNNIKKLSNGLVYGGI